MKSRCSNETTEDYKDYGARGIRVCEEWQTFLGFLNDMGLRPNGTTLDRVNVNGDYTRDNCRWATTKEQNNNKRFRMSRHERNTSGIIGLTFKKDRNVWRARHRNFVIYSGPCKETAINRLEEYHANRA